MRIVASRAAVLRVVIPPPLPAGAFHNVLNSGFSRLLSEEKREKLFSYGVLGIFTMAEKAAFLGKTQTLTFKKRFIFEQLIEFLSVSYRNPQFSLR